MSPPEHPVIVTITPGWSHTTGQTVNNMLACCDSMPGHSLCNIGGCAETFDTVRTLSDCECCVITLTVGWQLLSDWWMATPHWSTGPQS